MWDRYKNSKNDKYLIRIKSGDSRLFVSFSDINEIRSFFSKTKVNLKNEHIVPGIIVSVLLTLILSTIICMILQLFIEVNKHIFFAASSITFIITVIFIFCSEENIKLKIIDVDVSKFIFTKISSKTRVKVLDLIKLVLETGKLRKRHRKILINLLTKKEVV